MIEIIQAETPEQIAAARALFREYEEWLGMSLCFQKFDEEVANLPGKYAKPSGRLLLALIDEKIAGCVCLREIEENVCEMKRLFVRRNFQGQGVGKRLLEKLLEEARTLGYRKMRLDTFPPKMGKAVEIYKSYGFREISPYYFNPYDGVLFMEKDLSFNG